MSFYCTPSLTGAFSMKNDLTSILRFIRICGKTGCKGMRFDCTPWIKDINIGQWMPWCAWKAGATPGAVRVGQWRMAWFEQARTIVRAAIDRGCGPVVIDLVNGCNTANQYPIEEPLVWANQMVGAFCDIPNIVWSANECWNKAWLKPIFQHVRMMMPTSHKIMHNAADPSIPLGPKVADQWSHHKTSLPLWASIRPTVYLSTDGETSRDWATPDPAWIAEDGARVRMAGAAGLEIYFDGCYGQNGQYSGNHVREAGRTGNWSYVRAVAEACGMETRV
jgi:hypothetical protein